MIMLLSYVDFFIDEDVHGLLLWWKSLCYSCKCIQDKNGTRVVGQLIFFSENYQIKSVYLSLVT